MTFTIGEVLVGVRYAVVVVYNVPGADKAMSVVFAGTPLFLGACMVWMRFCTVSQPPPSPRLHIEKSERLEEATRPDTKEGWWKTISLLPNMISM